MERYHDMHNTWSRDLVLEPGEKAFSGEPFDSIKVSRSLRKHVLTDIDDTQPSQVAATIYSRLCQALRYDEAAFLSLSQEDRLLQLSMHHTEPDHIARIDSIVNQIVCFDFSIILARLLQDINLSNIITLQKRDTGLPGVKHVSCVAAMNDGYLLEFDPLKNFTNSDLLRIKIGLPANGISINGTGSKTALISQDIPDVDWGKISNPFQTIQKYLDKYTLPSVESASLTKKFLRTLAATKGGSIVDIKHYSVATTDRTPKLASIYSLSNCTDTITHYLLHNNKLTETSQDILCDSAPNMTLHGGAYED